MTLQEAIIEVLESNHGPMWAKDIASHINRRGLYERPDGNPVPTSQIHYAVNKYRRIFIKNGSGAILLREWDYYNPDKKDKNNIIHDKSSKESTTSKLLDSKYANNNLRPLDVTSEDNKKPIYQDRVSENEESILHHFEIIAGTISYFKITEQEGLPRMFAFFIFLGKFLKENEEKYHVYEKLKNTGKVNFLELKRISTDINKTPFYRGILEPYVIVMDVDWEDDLTQLFYILSSFFHVNYDVRVFGKLFNSFLCDLILEESEHHSSEISPDIISKILADFIPSNKFEVSVFDPAVGIGSSYIHLVRNRSTGKIYGNEINYITYSLLKINLYLNGVDQLDNFYLKDSLSPGSVVKEFADFAISHPPFNLKRKEEDITDILYDNIKPEDSNSAFLLLMLQSVKEKVFSVIPESFYFSDKYKKIRQYLVDSNFLETVITLPNDLFYPVTKAKAGIIVLSKVKKDRNITFINADDSLKVLIKNQRLLFDKDLKSYRYNLVRFYENAQNESSINRDNIISRKVSNETVIEKDYSFNPRIYTNPTNIVIDKIKGEDENLIRLEEIITTHRFQTISNKDLHEFDAIPYISIKHLANFPDSFHLDINKAIETPSKRQSGKIVDTNALLIAKIGKNLKPTYFKFIGNPIHVSNNIYVLQLDEDRILPEYLAIQLTSGFVSSQLKSVVTGTSIPHVSTKDLNNLYFSILPLLKQREEIDNFYKSLSEKNRILHHLDKLNIITTKKELKSEIEKYASQYFPNSDNVLFKLPLDFTTFPFSEKQIANGISISESDDQLIKYLLIKTNNDIHGVLVVEDENEIPSDLYNEINSFCGFLVKYYQSFTKSATNETLMRFAHTSKNFFAGIQGSLDSFINSSNVKLRDALKLLYIDDEEFIARKTQSGTAKKEDFLAINKLNELKTKISLISSFYFKTDKGFKHIVNEVPKAFNINEVLKDLTIQFDTLAIKIPENELIVHGKKDAIQQSFIDLIENAIKYSPNNACEILIDEFKNHVQFQLTNKVGNILLEDKYEALGSNWVTNSNGNPGSGVYWAYQLIHDSLGTIEKGEYSEYKDSKTFKLMIKLRKMN